jgi:hypothetical protein
MCWYMSCRRQTGERGGGGGGRAKREEGNGNAGESAGWERAHVTQVVCETRQSQLSIITHRHTHSVSTIACTVGVRLARRHGLKPPAPFPP